MAPIRKPGISIEVEGIPFLKRKFDRLSLTLQKGVIRRALRDGAKVIQAAAKATAPVGKKTSKDSASSRPGALRRSIIVRSAKRSRRNKRVLRIQVRTTEVGKQFLKKGFYPRAIEFGLPLRGISPNPFMKRAADSKGKEVVAIFNRQFRKALVTALKKRR